MKQQGLFLDNKNIIPNPVLKVNEFFFLNKIRGLGSPFGFGYFQGRKLSKIPIYAPPDCAGSTQKFFETKGSGSGKSRGMRKIGEITNDIKGLGCLT